MINHREVVFLFQPVFQRSEPILTNLIHTSALHTNQMMVMMLRRIRTQIIAGHTVSEIDFLHDMKLAKQFQGTIHGGKTDLGRLFLLQA